MSESRLRGEWAPREGSVWARPGYPQGWDVDRIPKGLSEMKISWQSGIWACLTGSGSSEILDLTLMTPRRRTPLDGSGSPKLEIQEPSQQPCTGVPSDLVKACRSHQGQWNHIVWHVIDSQEMVIFEICPGCSEISAVQGWQPWPAFLLWLCCFPTGKFWVSQSLMYKMRLTVDSSLILWWGPSPDNPGAPACLRWDTMWAGIGTLLPRAPTHKAFCDAEHLSWGRNLNQGQQEQGDTYPRSLGLGVDSY